MAIKTGAIKPDPQTTQQPQIQQQQQQQQLKQNPESHSVILVTAGYDNTIRFWEALSGICSRTIQHPNSVGNSTKLFVNNPNWMFIDIFFVVYAASEQTMYFTRQAIFSSRRFVFTEARTYLPFTRIDLSHYCRQPLCAAIWH
jgi:hypothetical protein